MTTAAQQALRRIMELHSNTTRFALACNISTKIIEPIQSRCAILRFSRLSNEQVVERVMQVMSAEKAGYTEVLYSYSMPYTVLIQHTIHCSHAPYTIHILYLYTIHHTHTILMHHTYCTHTPYTIHIYSYTIHTVRMHHT
jgi:hypothetical protein